MSTTRWLDSKTKDLDSAIDLLIDHVEDDSTGNILWVGWCLEKVFEENQSIRLNGRDIKYNLIKCRYEQISSGETPIEDRTVNKTTSIIVYYNGVSINYIIDQNSAAQKMLRKLLSYTGKNEITRNVYNFTTDFFIWLIGKVYNSDNVIEANNDDISSLQLESIKGVKGDTEDLQTKVTAAGESVMNIISTLSFLLESKRLEQIKIEFSYADHENISLILKNGTVSIDFAPYQGCFENETEDLIMAQIYLLVYLEILPILDQEYQSDIINGIWGENAYKKFMKNVAEEITQRIDNKIGILSANAHN